MIFRCFLWLKGTNLKANHNYIRLQGQSHRAVSCGSKVQIWKQITTADNSPRLLPCCFLWLKGTNLKANHNLWCKQRCLGRLFPVAQRYKFESKSQPSRSSLLLLYSCFLWLKGTNLKANHNVTAIKVQLNGAVSCGSKVQIWKQITTGLS